MEIEVKGHSGCSIEIVRENTALYIVKSTSDPSYVERLYRQAIKQQTASEVKMQFIRVPCIFEIKKADSSLSMKMEYVYSKNFMDYFESTGFEQVEYFLKAIRIFLQHELELSTLQPVPSSTIKNKYQDVKDKILSNENIKNDNEISILLYRSDFLFNSMRDEIEIPVGVCHGDLTFSNILFNGSNYYLIDFLDSFIESPLMDMVKLKQDSEYKWSVLMYTGCYDRTRYEITCQKIDTELNKFFSQYKWYSDNYRIFQLLNFLRILQYAHDENVISYLKKIINNILDNE